MADALLLNAAQVATLYLVDRSTVTRWAQKGILPTAGHTPSGDRLFSPEDVVAVYEARVVPLLLQRIERERQAAGRAERATERNLHMLTAEQLKNASADQRDDLRRELAEVRNRVLSPWLTHAAGHDYRRADLSALGFTQKDCDVLLAMRIEDLTRILPSPDLFIIAIEREGTAPADYVRHLAQQQGIALPPDFGQAQQPETTGEKADNPF